MRNDIAKNALRIHKESELEVVHVRLSNTVPALNIIGTYLNVESREKADDTKKNMEPLYRNGPTSSKQG